MYKEIDELIDAVCCDEVFNHYCECQKKLYDPHIMTMLSQHQILQEDYTKMKKYQKYVSNDDLKEKLMEIKKEMSECSEIQAYYQSHHKLNELLTEITEIVFKDISLELSFGAFQL